MASPQPSSAPAELAPSDPTVVQLVRDACVAARASARTLAVASTEQKNDALRRFAAALRRDAAGGEAESAVLGANGVDMAAAERHLGAAMLDRLRLDAGRMASMARAVEEVADLPDPVGQLVEERMRPTGLRVRRVRVPLGVIAMVYESRPNVTADAGALCIKSGNAIVLRGGSEARHSNQAIAQLLREALSQTGLAADAVQLVGTTSRDAIRALVQQVELVDLAIPRGGEALIRYVTEHARVPVVQHYKGVCHMFLDEGADEGMAVRLVTNAKLSRPGVCNALECLLVHRVDAPRVLPAVAKALFDGGAELRGCPRACELVSAMKPATDADWGAEFLAPVLAVRVVDSVDEALDHVARYGSGHTEAIVTPHAAHAERWRKEVDAACVMVNASTRFHDGGELGLGAEIGIATSRIHWRGPMGLESLTTIKWVVDGSGQVR